jgi:hypothetical protein
VTAATATSARSARTNCSLSNSGPLPNWRADPHRLLDGLIHRIENLNGREFDDDVAGLLVGSGD